MPGLQAAGCRTAAVWLCQARGLLVARGYQAVRYSRAWKPTVCWSQKLSGCHQGQIWQCAELNDCVVVPKDLRVARLSRPALFAVCTGQDVGEGWIQIRWSGTSSLDDEPWVWIAWALVEAMWRCLRRKKSVRGPKLHQATHIPTQRTVPTLILQQSEHIVQPDLASMTGRIAHASTQQTLPALQGSSLDLSMRSQHREEGAISLADAPPWIVQYSTVWNATALGRYTFHRTYSLSYRTSMVVWLSLTILIHYQQYSIVLTASTDDNSVHTSSHCPVHVLMLLCQVVCSFLHAVVPRMVSLTISFFKRLMVNCLGGSLYLLYKP